MSLYVALQLILAISMESLVCLSFAPYQECLVEVYGQPKGSVSHMSRRHSGLIHLDALDQKKTTNEISLRDLCLSFFLLWEELEVWGVGGQRFKREDILCYMIHEWSTLIRNSSR